MHLDEIDLNKIKKTLPSLNYILQALLHSTGNLSANYKCVFMATSDIEHLYQYIQYNPNL